MATRTVKPKAPESIAIPMTLTKETKNKDVYGCDTEGVAADTLYVAKGTFGDTPPTNIVVHIAPVA